MFPVSCLWDAWQPRWSILCISHHPSRTALNQLMSTALSFPSYSGQSISWMNEIMHESMSSTAEEKKKTLLYTSVVRNSLFPNFCLCANIARTFHFPHQLQSTSSLLQSLTKLRREPTSSHGMSSRKRSSLPRNTSTPPAQSSVYLPPQYPSHRPATLPPCNLILPLHWPH